MLKQPILHNQQAKSVKEVTQSRPGCTICEEVMSILLHLAQQKDSPLNYPLSIYRLTELANYHYH